MELMLKQRLVGAAVIIALAVVLIPMILDGAGKHLVPDIPHEPNYLKTHLAEETKTPGLAPAIAKSGKKPVAVVPMTTVTVPAKKSHPVTRHASGFVATPRMVSASSSSKGANKRGKIAHPPARKYPPRQFNGSRAHTSAAKKVQHSRKAVKVARAGTGQLAVPRVVNSQPARRKSVYAAIKVWSVQIASFKSPNNARLLKRKLDRAGFKAYIRLSRAHRGRPAIYRVRIGPEKTHSSARATLTRLRQKVRLNGYITSHK